VSAGVHGQVHFVVPEGIDDPGRVSGGNVWDQHVRDGLTQLGWDVRMVHVDPDAAADLDAALSALPGGALVLIDGLVGTRSPAPVEGAAGRLRIVLLAHMVAAGFPDAEAQTVDGERRSLRSARRVIATSEWTRSELARRQIVPAELVDVAPPGSDEAPLATGTATGGALLCVGVVAPQKGQDLLIEALSDLRDAGDWSCTMAGSLDADPAYAQRLETRVADAGLTERVTMAGVLTEDELDRAYGHTDLVVAPSRAESYGMAIADALRRGIPVVASSAGGIPQTVAGSRAALLVPPDQSAPLADALRRWMLDPALRARLKAEARRGRGLLPRWSETADRVSRTLGGVR
jgi:glycosyltransferase involved in cell wall biosynthesis